MGFVLFVEALVDVRVNTAVLKNDFTCGVLVLTDEQSKT